MNAAPIDGFLNSPLPSSQKTTILNSSTPMTSFPVSMATQNNAGAQVNSSYLNPSPLPFPEMMPSCLHPPFDEAKEGHGQRQEQETSLGKPDRLDNEPTSTNLQTTYQERANHQYQPQKLELSRCKSNVKISPNEIPPKKAFDKNFLRETSDSFVQDFKKLWESEDGLTDHLGSSIERIPIDRWHVWARYFAHTVMNSNPHQEQPSPIGGNSSPHFSLRGEEDKSLMENFSELKLPLISPSLGTLSPSWSKRSSSSPDSPLLYKVPRLKEPLKSPVSESPLEANYKFHKNYTAASSPGKFFKIFFG